METWAAEHEIKFKDISELEVRKTISGDVNGDEEVSVSDVILFQKWLHGVPETSLANWKNADLNQDGRLNIFDFCLLKRLLLNQPETSSSES